MSTSAKAEYKFGALNFAQKIFRWISTALSVFACTPSIAYDNSKFPPFQSVTADRKFQQISIHPNGEEWLITEEKGKNYLLLYSLKTKRLQRYETPGNYEYTFAAFTRTGDQIVMIRRELPAKDTYSDWQEILFTDACLRQVLPRRARALRRPRQEGWRTIK